jgi:uncharacterized protein (TIGR02271 family)
MATSSDVLSWRGQDALDSDGDKIGKIEEIYLDAESNEPEWALINTGMFGTKRSFVPLRNASPSGDGITVGFDKDTVKNAPKVDPDGRLSQQEEAALYRHYDFEYSEYTGGEGDAEYARDESGADFDTADADADTDTARADTDTDTARGDTDTDTATDAASTRRAGGGDHAMTRSEEELTVGKAERETGRARLKKYVVEEEVTETVPVRREEVRVEREPITDENRDAAMSGPEITESEHEVVLHEEEPVAEKRTVPKERIRLDKDVHEDEQEVSDTVRRERIDVDDEGAR